MEEREPALSSIHRRASGVRAAGRPGRELEAARPRLRALEARQTAPTPTKGYYIEGYVEG